MGAPNANKRSVRITSREIFRAFFVRDEDGQLDATELFGKKCFETWVSSRAKLPMSVPRAFQCAIRNVVTGANGAKCFTADEESAALKYLRVKRKDGWACFEGAGHSGNFGWKHIKGWHEKNSEEKINNGEAARLTLSNDLPGSLSGFSQPPFFFSQMPQQTISGILNQPPIIPMTETFKYENILKLEPAFNTTTVQTLKGNSDLNGLGIEAIMDQVEALYDPSQLNKKRKLEHKE